jgi:K+-transporting ATPase ATPase C chain
MLSQIRPALTIFVLLTILTGVAYPALVTGIAQIAFPYQANGSVLVERRNSVGSELIGQSFDDPRYFWGRPSATSPSYNGASSGGSNLGPINTALLDVVKGRIETVKAAHPDQSGDVPIDLVTASASGLDPHISPAAVEFQVSRVAVARGLDPDQVRRLVPQFTEGRQWGVLGEPRVNVLKLNLALDKGTSSGQTTRAHIN